MTEFQQILQDIKEGEEGRNRSVSMGFHKLNRYITIRKKVMTLVFGPTGAGKSSLIHEMYILNPFEWYMSNKAHSKIRIKPILFAYERSKTFTRAKWLSRKIFKDNGVEIPISKMLGWQGEKMNAYEMDLVMMYEDYINELMEFVTIIDGADNPTGAYKFMKRYAEANGRTEQVSEHKKIYVPNNEYEIVVPIVDHIGLTKLERGYTSKKQSIDKLTEYAQEWRDNYGYSPVFVAQLNRELSGLSTGKAIQDIEPNIDQIKETGTPAEAADVVMSIFEPLRYNTTAPGYDALKFVNPETGAKPFRSLKILKNTYGEDSIRIATVMHGASGTFAELPHKSQMESFNYQSVIDGSYFRQYQQEDIVKNMAKKPFSFSQVEKGF